MTFTQDRDPGDETAERAPVSSDEAFATLDRLGTASEDELNRALGFFQSFPRTDMVAAGLDAIIEQLSETITKRFPKDADRLTGDEVVAVLQNLDTVTEADLRGALVYLNDHFPTNTEELFEAYDRMCGAIESTLEIRFSPEAAVDAAIQAQVNQVAESAYQGGYEAGYADAMQGTSPVFPPTDEAADTIPVNAEALGMELVIRTGIEAGLPITHFLPGMVLILRQGLEQIAHALSGKPVGTVDGVTFLDDVITIKAEILPEGNFRGVVDGMMDRAAGEDLRQAA